uniref:Predicted protein n=1 Tax=Hordeum vulgare subsp. vulgare TaxID=112509 RepID=F2D2Z3_HORVV|nr:predicted protein [Hordeum vulgare subsp. vulgare]
MVWPLLWMAQADVCRMMGTNWLTSIIHEFWADSWWGRWLR